METGCFLCSKLTRRRGKKQELEQQPRGAFFFSLVSFHFAGAATTGAFSSFFPPPKIFIAAEMPIAHPPRTTNTVCSSFHLAGSVGACQG